jgi:hypothetical protein
MEIYTQVPAQETRDALKRLSAELGYPAARRLDGQGDEVPDDEE